ncbi:MAG: YciI family protein [Erythrobacter sp.]|nr:YciI family protein [Erythrobacter sp.]
MQYMLLINEDESIYEGENGAKLMEETLAGHMALAQKLTEKGIEFSGERLKPGATATTIKWDHGKQSLHDGPFAETHEELGGFYIIDVASLDEALDWAKMLPIPGRGAIEVRPVWPMGE